MVVDGFVGRLLRHAHQPDHKIARRSIAMEKTVIVDYSAPSLFPHIPVQLSAQGK